MGRDGKEEERGDKMQGKVYKVKMASNNSSVSIPAVFRLCIVGHVSLEWLVSIGRNDASGDRSVCPCASCSVPVA